MKKTGIPQGTRDFDAVTVRKRQYILNVIRSIFELYGFTPLETPAIENVETLMGKYGEEGDKLIFKLRSNKNLLTSYPGMAEEVTRLLKSFTDLDYTFLPHESKSALKYDLTIPFARYVAMNHGQLTFPFKRYQVQQVWRGDRPQKGRYREFTQCDADVVGSTALFNEVELALIYHQAFTGLGLKDYTLSVNSRKILSALATLCGGADKMMDITIAIDKLDKIGLEKVKEELGQRGLTPEQVDLIGRYLLIDGDNMAKLAAVKALLGDIEEGRAGIAELEYVLTTVLQLAPEANLSADFTLARGLNYYTGIIFEVKAPPAVRMGSIGGGGRYDDLTGLFGVPNVPGVGISFGIDRIYDVMEELQLFPENLQSGATVLFFNMGEAESGFAFTLLQDLRGRGISGELYHETAKMDKQFRYAEKKHIPFAVIIGSREMESGTCVVKDLRQGIQQTISTKELFAFLTK